MQLLAIALTATVLKLGALQAAEPVKLSEQGAIRVDGEHIFATAFSPDGHSLAVATQFDKVHVFDPATRKRILSIGRLNDENNDYFSSVAYSPDGKRLVIAETFKSGRPSFEFRGRIHFGDAASGVLEKSAEFDALASAITFARTSNTVAIGQSSGQVALFDANSSKQLRQLGDGRDSAPIASLAFDARGGQLAAALRSLPLRGLRSPDAAPSGGPPFPDREIVIWDTSTGKVLQRLKKDGAGGANWICYSPDGKTLAAAYTDGNIRLWDPINTKLLASYAAGAAQVLSVAWSPDSRLLASGSQDGKICLWDAKTGQRLFWTDRAKQLAGVTTVAFSPDGKLLATGGSLSSVLIWNVVDPTK